MTLSGCLSRGSRGRDCCVLCAIYGSFEELYILLRFSLQERCLRGVMRHRSLCGAGNAVWMRVWEVWLCQARIICRSTYSQIVVLSLREDVREDLMFRRCRRGVG